LDCQGGTPNNSLFIINGSQQKISIPDGRVVREPLFFYLRAILVQPFCRFFFLLSLIAAAYSISKSRLQLLILLGLSGAAAIPLWEVAVPNRTIIGNGAYYPLDNAYLLYRVDDFSGHHEGQENQQQ
jgi:hypothetical protein